MEFIKPAEVSSKIMTLIDEADKYLIIVSPYNDLVNWDKLVNRIANAQRRGVTIAYFVRSNASQRGLDRLNLKPVYIPNLHAKFYANEKYAIVASMNLVKYSDDNSLDIGVLLSESGEMQQLQEFYRRHIKTFAEKRNTVSDSISKGLPENLKIEIPFEQYYSTDPLIDDLSTCDISKEYFHGTALIKSFGLSQQGQRISNWIIFSESGFVQSEVRYRDGEIEREVIVEYDGETSLYWFLLSLANLVGALYATTINQLYFKSLISDYCNDRGQRLRDYLQEHLSIQFHGDDHISFEDLSRDIKWYLKGNLSQCPYWRNEKFPTFHG